MNFAPGSSDWKPVPVKPDAQTFVLKQVAADQPIAFSISGSGQLPREDQNANGSTAAPGTSGGPATSGSMEADTRPGGGLGPPVDTPDPINKFKPWLLGGLGALLLAGAVWLMRGKPSPATRPNRPPRIRSRGTGAGPRRPGTRSGTRPRPRPETRSASPWQFPHKKSREPASIRPRDSAPIKPPTTSARFAHSSSEPCSPSSANTPSASFRNPSTPKVEPPFKKPSTAPSLGKPPQNSLLSRQTQGSQREISITFRRELYSRGRRSRSSQKGAHNLLMCAHNVLIMTT